MLPLSPDRDVGQSNNELVSFLCKVSPVKTRHGEDKDYYAFRAYIPKEAAQKLKLDDGDYIFVRAAEKAKWYHMLEWKELPDTWKMIPENLKTEIVNSGIETPAGTLWDQSSSAPTQVLSTALSFYQDLSKPRKSNVKSPAPSDAEEFVMPTVTTASSRYT